MPEEFKFDDRFSNNNLAALINKSRESSMQREAAIREIAQVDELTGIGNRNALNAELLRLTERLGPGKRIEDIDYILCFFFDLNNLKPINDTFGHIIGDEALKAFARAMVEDSNSHGGKAFRFGGDEFITLQAGKGELKEDPSSIALRVEEKLNKSLYFMVDNERHSFSVSVGCSVLSRDYTKTIEELKKEADQMMYERKAIHHSKE